MAKTKKEEKEFADKLPARQDGKLNIYFHISENSGVGYYRQFVLAQEIQNQNLANVLISDFRWGEGDHKQPTDDQMFAIANWADIIVVGRLDQPAWLARWGGIREFFNMPIVMDTDDNVRRVPITNPGYQGYHPGSEGEHWSKVAFARVFDAITVSTDELKEFHQHEHPKIYVVPNALDLNQWKVKLKKHKDNKIRIIFNGSASHMDSVKIIKKPLLQIMTEYPNVEFLIMRIFKGIFDDYPPEVRARIKFLDWIPLKTWAKGMAAIGADIGLAPLADNYFNRSKSNLRWMEFSALKIPVICSPVRAYECVVDKVTGLLALEKEVWYNAIKSLVEDKELRKSLGENAYDYVKEHFNIATNAPKTLVIYEEIVKKYHNFFGDKKRYVHLEKDKWKLLK